MKTKEQVFEQSWIMGDGATCNHRVVMVNGRHVRTEYEYGGKVKIERYRGGRLLGFEERAI